MSVLEALRFIGAGVFVFVCIIFIISFIWSQYEKRHSAK